LFLIQSLPSLPGVLLRLRGNVRSCVLIPVESCFWPQNQFPGLYPLLCFFHNPSNSIVIGTLEYWLAKTVSR
jgi:hypothetical protein